MEQKPRELYHDEITNLKDFRSKIAAKSIFKEDLEEFSDQYEELIAQAKVITRVSDRLQKKLDNANIQIQDQNGEIKDKNLELGNTVEQLAKAKMGRKASTILFAVAIALFLLEQILLQPIIDKYISIPYVGLVVLILLFLGVKAFEGALESYFMAKEKRRIIEARGEEEGKDTNFNSSFARF